MILVVARSDVLFGFDQPLFARTIGQASNIARPTIRVPRKKFFQNYEVLF